ncbi:expressed unknown protein [Seminavis robusta]|uniref:Uncharacterized protein n=1 Tax=Seminavis robusta TaxID=568900 RepID=A0A9N8DWJ6_9STRA|nr:expressed unknown protein [Seminavis robusta]|eukprot:Sro418_g138960.1 n/a (658) ;mRNA; f:59495-61626
MALCLSWTTLRAGLICMAFVCILANLNGSRLTSKAVFDLLFTDENTAVTLPEHVVETALSKLTDAQLESLYFGGKENHVNASNAGNNQHVSRIESHGKKKIRGQPFHETEETAEERKHEEDQEEPSTRISEGQLADTTIMSTQQDRVNEKALLDAAAATKERIRKIKKNDLTGTVDNASKVTTRETENANEKELIDSTSSKDTDKDANENVDTKEADNEDTNEENDTDVEEHDTQTNTLQTASTATNTTIHISTEPAWSPSWVSDETGSPYTYAMFSWLCDPDDKEHSMPAYKSYLANILVAAKLLRDFGSKADFNAVIKMKYGSNHTRLLQEDEAMMETMGIRVTYLPQTKDGANFYVDQLNKMYILNMTQYRRVLFLDGDVMPMNNLDYLFELSDGPNPLLKENAVLAGYTEPANGGFFMMRPNATAYLDIQRIIALRPPQSLKRLRWFDQVQGWGHAIVPPDMYESNHPKTQGTKWKFHGAFTDQGLIYSYPKYNLRSMTQIFSRKIVNFGPGPNGTTIVEKVINVTSVQTSPFSQYTQPQFDFSPGSCMMFTYKYAPDWPGCVPPYADHSHFTGKKKPWSYRKPDDLWEETKPRNDFYLWWRTLDQLQQSGINITFSEATKVSKNTRKPKEKKTRKKRGKQAPSNTTTTTEAR